jgi:hypothetical protein
MPNLLPVGTIVSVRDRIADDVLVTATIRLVEQDNEFPDLFWYYLVANEEVLNDKLDNRIGMYWEILENASNRISVVSMPTNE